MEEYVVETMEETVEEEVIVDTPTEESSASVPDDNLDPQQNEPTENELLMEYIKRELLQNENIEEDNEESEQVSEISAMESSQQDYFEILSELGAIKNELIYQTAIYDDYNDNNHLFSNIDDISLSNTLLLLIFISTMFAALISFSRRIF